jgi:uncharacterized protein YifE (UPF0438 family)
LESDSFELSPEERILLEKYLSFYEALDHGTRKPKTAAQQHFIDVCKGRTSALTLHELAYMKHKINLAKSSSSKKRSRSNVKIPRNEEGTPNDEWFSTTDWKKGRAGQYGDMNNNHRD